tara:strand:- start:1337 stop:3235 length:1899 start_codon:yes stop_codon:yes gene_type:complete
MPQTIKDIVELLETYDHHYHTLGEPLVTDEEYDKIKDSLRAKNPKHPYFKRVGADIDNSVALPYYMGSLDKIKDDQKVIDRWTKKYKVLPYVISDKLDGISCMVLYTKDTGGENTVRLMTRGNGTHGKDITYIKDLIQGIPIIPIDSSVIAVRGELIMRKMDFKPEYGSNPRNVVAGLVNAKTLKKDLLKYVRFVAYSVVEPRRMSMNEQISWMRMRGFEVVHSVNTDTLTVSSLCNILKSRRDKGLYEVDGIVATDNDPSHSPPNDENPKYAFAFKSITTHETKDVVVSNVEWNVSKAGYLKPRVLFDPVDLDGVQISVATGHNAKFIKDSEIGEGAVITIIRSGGVIPKIIGVVKGSKKNSFPPTDTFTWNKTNVDIISATSATSPTSTSSKNPNIAIKELTFMFKSLDIKNIAEKTVRRLYEGGYKSVFDLLNVKDPSLLCSIDGISTKTADNIINEVKKIPDRSLLDIMVASNMFGRGMGERKIKLILNNIPDPVSNTIITKDMLKAIDGIGEENAKCFLEGLEMFKVFYHKIREYSTASPAKNTTLPEKSTNNTKNKKFNDLFVVFSGFRNAEWKQIIEEGGGEVQSGINKNTTLVVGDGETLKIKAAKEKGIDVLYVEDFKKIVIR